MIKRKNIVIGVTVLAVILSTGAAAYAATDTTTGQTAKERTNVMANLTETQRDAVMQARTDSMKEAVAELVDNGTITQEIADQLPEAKMTVKEKPDLALTDEQRTALREEEKTVFESKLADLVDEGTFTQDQIDQMDQGHKMIMSADLTDAQKEALMQARTDEMKEAAANLEEKRTLAQDEADKITAAIAAMPKEKPAEKSDEKPASILTDAQGTALKEAMQTIFESKLSDLVDKGTITQDQADQLLSDEGALHIGPGGPGHGHGGPGGFPGTEGKTDQTEQSN
jgi:hypothetical protein